MKVTIQYTLYGTLCKYTLYKVKHAVQHTMSSEVFDGAVNVCALGECMYLVCGLTPSFVVTISYCHSQVHVPSTRADCCM